MYGMTARQEMVLDIIVRSVKERMYPPTLREIGSEMGIRSTNGVNDHLRALTRKGYIDSEELKSRGIILTKKTRDLYGLHFRYQEDGAPGRAVERLLDLTLEGASGVDLSTSTGAEQGADTALRAVLGIIREEQGAGKTSVASVA